MVQSLFPLHLIFFSSCTAYWRTFSISLRHRCLALPFLSITVLPWPSLPTSSVTFFFISTVPPSFPFHCRLTLLQGKKIFYLTLSIGVSRSSTNFIYVIPFPRPFLTLVSPPLAKKCSCAPRVFSLACVWEWSNRGRPKGTSLPPTTSPWSVRTAREWLETAQTEGVGASGSVAHGVSVTCMLCCFCCCWQHGQGYFRVTGSGALHCEWVLCCWVRFGILHLFLLYS